MQDIIKVIESIYDRGEFSYIFSTYVDKNFWQDRLKKYFSGLFIENLTDFNYSKCFSMYINLSNTDACVGSEKFDSYIIKNNFLDRLLIQISLLAPYCTFKYLRYIIDGNKISCVYSDNPFCSEHFKFQESILKFIMDSNITLLSNQILMTEVPGKSLELKEAPVSVYNCLFEDTDSYYPYWIDKREFTT